MQLVSQIFTFETMQVTNSLQKKENERFILILFITYAHNDANELSFRSIWYSLTFQREWFKIIESSDRDGMENL